MADIAPFGSWRSPVTPELLVAGAAVPIDAWASASTRWWSETRPSEGGRIQLVRRDGDGPPAELLPEGFNARTRVHEYGGGECWVAGETVFFANWSDQRLYRLDPGADPVPITPEPPEPAGWRYADGSVMPDGRHLVCVRESHLGGEVRNELVAVATDGSGVPVVLASGRDFVASPRISRDGKQLAWLAWDHPRMPWDGTELWVGRLESDGVHLEVTGARREAGGPDESLVQPEWGRHGYLFVVSDRSNWWNVYRVDGVDVLTPVHPVEAEVGRPAWVFGQSRYGVTRDGTVVLTYERDGRARLVTVPEDGVPAEHELPYASLESLRVDEGRVTFVAAGTTHEPVVATAPLARPSEVTEVRPARDLGFDPASLSRPEAVTFPTSGGQQAHGWFYPPANADFVGPSDEKPPLVVMIHGGPTSAARPRLSLAVQFWTSRGIAVVDVDYRGSTGYGRTYRRLLDGQWGVADVDDCCAAAAWLADQGRVDPERLAIRGGSAGGFTTLAALALRDTFRAGASYYGVADLGALARDTHKFESRYLDGLIGPWPEAEEVYRERSPLTHVDGIDEPLLVLQGLEDEVVPPAQSEVIVAALDAKGVPHAYLAFEGEQHGFRRAETIMRALTAELYFYSRVFRFGLAAPIEPVTIAHEESL